MHIGLSFPDSFNSSSFPILRQIQAGILRLWTSKGSPSKRIRLSIMPAILDRLKNHWEKGKNPDRLVLWVVSTLCFMGFFHVGELLPMADVQPTCRNYIQWGDVTVNDGRTPSMLQIHL